MINPIKLYLGLAALAVTVTAVVSALSSEDEEAPQMPKRTEDDKKDMKAYKKARKKEIKKLHGIDMTDVTEIDVRSGSTQIIGNVLVYDDVAQRPFVTKNTLVIGKQEGSINKLMRKVSYKEVRLDKFDPSAITVLKADDSSGFSFKSNVDLPNAEQKIYNAVGK